MTAEFRECREFREFKSLEYPDESRGVIRVQPTCAGRFPVPEYHRRLSVEILKVSTPRLYD